MQVHLFRVRTNYVCVPGKILRQKDKHQEKAEKRNERKGWPRSSRRQPHAAANGWSFCGIFLVSTYFEPPRSLKHCQALFLEATKECSLIWVMQNKRKREEFPKEVQH